MNRLLLVLVASTALLVSTPLGCAAQDASGASSPEMSRVQTENLTFSKDGRLLHEIQSVSPTALGTFWSVRAITYDAATGSISHLLKLGPDTSFFSATTDGRTAVISVDRDRKDARPHLLLVDMETGQTRNIPSKWFDANDDNPYAQISGDGRLVSAYTDSGPEGGGLVVTLYDWRTKEPVAKQSNGYPAGGISWGGVTEDGKIDFLNNRMGGGVVDPKTGRPLVSYGPLSLRSSNGAWVVDFPNPEFAGAEDATKDIPIKNGMNGQTLGKLDLRLTDEEASWWWKGAFCGTSGRFIAAGPNEVLTFDIPSGKKLESLPPETWQDQNTKDRTTIVACSPSGKRVAIRSGTRLTLHDIK